MAQHFNDFLATLSGGQRAEALYAYFGQGSTIHHLTAWTGCTAPALLTDPLEHSGPLGGPASLGWAAITTCKMEYRRDVLAPKRRGAGETAYWHGVIAGYWLSHWQKAERLAA